MLLLHQKNESMSDRLLRLSSAPVPPAKKPCPAVPLLSVNAQLQLQVCYTGGKVLGKGGQTEGVVAGLVEFGSSGMNIPVVVKKYDMKKSSSVTAYWQELAALTAMKKSRSVVKLLGTCAEGLVLERLPLDLRDLFEASHTRQGNSTYQVHYLLDRPSDKAVHAKEFITRVYIYMTIIYTNRQLLLS